MVLAAGVSAVLFDVDGTLFQMAYDADTLKRAWSARYDVSLGTIAEMLAAMPVANRLDALAELSDAECAGVAAGAPVPDASDVVRKVRERVPVAVVSRNGAAAVGAALSALGHPDVPVVARGDAAAEKPAAAPVLEACRLLDRSAAAAVVVGDSAHDVGCATAAGARSIVVPNPDLAWPPGGATAYVEQLSDVVPLIEQWLQ